MRRATLFRAVALLASLCLLVACDGQGPIKAVTVGTALQPVTRTESTLQPLPPGDEFVMLRAWIENRSEEPLTLKRVAIKGLNLDRVVSLERVQIAPLPESADSGDFVSGGIYKTYPPVWKFGDRQGCNRQTVSDVAGYVLQPGSFGRVLVLLRAETAGDFSVLNHEVIYEQGGETYSQNVPAQLIGEVDADAQPLPLERAERRCLSDGVRVVGIS